MTKPRVYCASPSARLKMWNRQMNLLGPAVTIVSTWHDNNNFDADDDSAQACAMYWEKDFAEIRQADVLLAYAELLDKPNGTLVEIGYALAHDTPVHLVGNFKWGTWRHHPLVTRHATLKGAVDYIIGWTTPPSGIEEGASE